MLRVSHYIRHSETTLSFYFGDVVDDDLVVAIARFSEVVRGGVAGLVEVVPCACSLFVEFHILGSSVEEVKRCVGDLLDGFSEESLVVRSERVVELPVYYDAEVAPDLLMLARDKGLSVEEVVRLHSEVEYRVASLGFAPGFAYLSGLNPELAVGRMSSPKVVAKGSVGIAGGQTAVYPRSSPGGWVIVGNCPVDLFDLGRDPITDFEVGGVVRFRPVGRDEFIEMGGVV